MVRYLLQYPKEIPQGCHAQVLSKERPSYQQFLMLPSALLRKSTMRLAQRTIGSCA